MSGANSRTTKLIHATAVAVEGRAVVLLGPSGSGKSDLALRCLMLDASIDGRTIRPELVADDQVHVEATGGTLSCRAPDAIAGLIEIRGIGIVPFPFCTRAEIVLAAILASGPIERLPEPSSYELLGVTVPKIALAPFESSAPLKLLLALARSGR